MPFKGTAFSVQRYDNVSFQRRQKSPYPRQNKIAFSRSAGCGDCCHGIDFASKNVLQFGVALLGLGVTIDQVVSIGIVPLVVVMFTILLTLISGPLLARFFKTRLALRSFNQWCSCNLWCVCCFSNCLGITKK